MTVSPRTEFSWFSICDPDGVVHCLGKIEESHDWTECGREFATVEGWRGTSNPVPPFCGECTRIVESRLLRGYNTSTTTTTEPIHVTWGPHVAYWPPRRPSFRQRLKAAARAFRRGL